MREVTTFTDIMKVDGVGGVNGWQTYQTPHPVSARYIRIYVVDNFGYTHGVLFVSLLYIWGGNILLMFSPIKKKIGESLLSIRINEVQFLGS